MPPAINLVLGHIVMLLLTRGATVGGVNWWGPAPHPVIGSGVQFPIRKVARVGNQVLQGGAWGRIPRLWGHILVTYGREGPSKRQIHLFRTSLSTSVSFKRHKTNVLTSRASHSPGSCLDRLGRVPILTWNDPALSSARRTDWQRVAAPSGSAGTRPQTPRPGSW